MPDAEEQTVREKGRDEMRKIGGEQCLRNQDRVTQWISLADLHFMKQAVPSGYADLDAVSVHLTHFFWTQ